MTKQINVLDGVVEFLREVAPAYFNESYWWVDDVTFTLHLMDLEDGTERYKIRIEDGHVVIKDLRLWEGRSFERTRIDLTDPTSLDQLAAYIREHECAT